MSDITLTVQEEAPLRLKYVEAKIKPEQTKNVVPTYEPQTVLPDAGMTLGQVNVAAIPDPTEVLEITENGEHHVERIGVVDVQVPQGVFPSGELEITENGLHNVHFYESVDVQVPQGVFPTGTIEITQNGDADVTNYANVHVAVPGIIPSGTKQINITQNGTTTHNIEAYESVEITANVNTDPAKAFMFDDYDADGYPHGIRFVGTWTEIPRQYLCQLSSGNTKFTQYVTKIAIPDSVQYLRQSAFQQSRFSEIVMPDNDLTIEGYAIYNNTKIKELIFKKNVILDAAGHQFFNCILLEKIVFGGNVNCIPNNCFANTRLKLAELDFSHCTAIPPLYSVASLAMHIAGCVIRIPAALSDTTLGEGNGWESSGNWATLSDVVWEVV